MEALDYYLDQLADALAIYRNTGDALPLVLATDSVLTARAAETEG